MEIDSECDKTKILIFSKGPMLKTKFYYNNMVKEGVSDFKYLGVHTH